MCDYYLSFMSYYWGILHIFQRLLSVINNTLTKLLYSFLKYIANVITHNCPNDTIHHQSLLWFNYNLVPIELLDVNWQEFINEYYLYQYDCICLLKYALIHLTILLHKFRKFIYSLTLWINDYLCTLIKISDFIIV